MSLQITGSDCLFMAEQYSIVYIYHIFLIHVSVCEQRLILNLGYCEESCYKHGKPDIYLLNIPVSLFLSIHLATELLDGMMALSPSEGPLYCSSQWLS